ncbi:putative NADH dehydrogenase -like protein [Zalerion maritima]|uniref:NADH dehydrogenase -like protein n=1 Tax=Zalerion maritima TaxID=339359 RepID=A0AAD5WUB0_9PEZI|nr:putative NADH dehydrogenase -like protein [Zalerion maritima]
MRYEDWDVLLFPSDSRDEDRPPIPIREFKTQCHVVPDSEVTLAHGSMDIPILTCCVPGLKAGTPFNISMHSWAKPVYSQFTRNCATPADRVQFQARVYVDGTLASSVVFGRRGPWPLVINQLDHINPVTGATDLEFPTFHHDLLQINSWAPDEDLGRIRIVLSEGFASSEQRPFVRVKNILAFSFQHAPLDVLEGNGIAWPNPIMWRQAAMDYAPSPKHSLVETHAHSPRNVEYYPRRLALPTHARGLPIDSSPELMPPRLPTHRYHTYDRSSGRSSEAETEGSPFKKRAIRQSYSDISMPDYGPAGLMDQLTLSSRPGDRGRRKQHEGPGLETGVYPRHNFEAPSTLVTGRKTPVKSPFGSAVENPLQINTSAFGKPAPMKAFENKLGQDDDADDSEGSSSGSGSRGNSDDESTPTGGDGAFSCRESRNPFVDTREEQIL